jgi:DNA-directed RNA polymerase subunit omega
MPITIRSSRLLMEVKMARVTVEDCLQFVENRFALVHLASMRTKQLHKGSGRLVRCKNREAVCSLREIADGKVRPIEAEDPKK